MIYSTIALSWCQTALLQFLASLITTSTIQSALVNKLVVKSFLNASKDVWSGDGIENLTDEM